MSTPEGSHTRCYYLRTMRYEDSYRLCYVRGPEGVIAELAEQIG